METKAGMAFQDRQGTKEIEDVRCHAQTHMSSHEGIFLLSNLDFVFPALAIGDPGPRGIKGEKGKSTLRKATLSIYKS